MHHHVKIITIHILEIFSTLSINRVSTCTGVRIDTWQLLDCLHPAPESFSPVLQKKRKDCVSRMVASHFMTKVSSYRPQHLKGWG